VTGSDAGGSGLKSLTAGIDGGAPETLPAAGGTVDVGAHGDHTVAITALDHAGRAHAAADAARVDLEAPTADLACTPLGGGRHRCTPQASDSGSGIASLRLVRDGQPVDGQLTPGTAFEIAGPDLVSVAATDHVGRGATSPPMQLPGPAQEDQTTTTTTTTTPTATASQPPRASAPAPVPVSPVSPVAPHVLAAPVTARGSARLGTGTGVLELTAQGTTRRAVAILAAGRLKPGVYRLAVCLKAGKCTTKTVTLKKAGKPPVVRVDVAARPGEVAVTFAVTRKAGGKWRKVAAAGTSARLG
jgi:hypothetical protein